MRVRRTTACVLVSGGIDSVVLLQQVLRGGMVLPIYLQFGLRWERAELFWLRRLLRAIDSPRLLSLHVIRMPLHSVYGAHWGLTGHNVPAAASPDRAVYLPGRNVLLISHAASVCAQRGISTIALGVLKGNPFSDATPRFFRRLATCLSQALEFPLQIVTPLRRMTKIEVIRSAAAEVPLHLTFSCLKPRGALHCGRCNKCAERAQAFAAAGFPDPTRYA